MSRDTDDYQPVSASWPLYRSKGRVLGPPMQISRLVHERLGEVVTLAVLASDHISSSAYGAEQPFQLGRSSRACPPVDPEALATQARA